MIARIPLLALALLATPAGAQESYVLDEQGNVVATEVYVGEYVEDVGEDYGVPLAPGEEIVGFYAAPSILRMPVEAEILHETAPYVPPVEIDRVTGLPRNTTGWTGEAEEPLGIGCFPRGVCTGLNE